MKTLYLLRHAKSDWSDPSLDDHDRPLNQRGRKARKLIAHHVEGWPVDVIVCSTATRARETIEPVATALGGPVTYEPAIYAADVPELLAVVRALPDDADAVLLVGHNPGFEDLAGHLSGTFARFPTAALGTIELDVERWTDVRAGTGRLVALVTPAELQA